jgi:pimeloyl-ACP methyl ester carboxylesterase
LAALGRRSPALFLRLATSELPEVDRLELARAEPRDAFVAGYIEAFRIGSAGVAQDLRLLVRPWGFDLGAIRAPTWIHHGEADTTVPPEHARRFAAAIPRAEVRIHPGHGHFSLLGAAAAEIIAPLAAPAQRRARAAGG